MNERLNLYTYARRYCMERSAYWIKKYQPIDNAAWDKIGDQGYVYTDEAYDIFPRPNLVDAILHAVETLDSDDLPGTETLNQQLCDFGFKASSDSTGFTDNQIASAAELSERYAFVEAIEKASSTKLPDQSPLFYRRVLNQVELKTIWQKLSDVWGVTESCWYPLGQKTHPSLVALDISEIDLPKFNRNLKKFLAHQGCDRIYELREDGGNNYLLDADVVDPFYDGYEGFWSSPNNDWIIYCSHEDTITLGGTAVTTRV